MPDAAIERDADGEYRWSRYGQLVIILLETITFRLTTLQTQVSCTPLGEINGLGVLIGNATKIQSQ